MHRILILFLLIFFNNHAQIENDIEEVFPIFPICKLIPDNKQNKCFDESMFEHIEKNFKYPQTAWDLDLESLVRIRFVINEFDSFILAEILEECINCNGFLQNLCAVSFCWHSAINEAKAATLRLPSSNSAVSSILV